MIELPRLAASNYSNSAPLVWSFWKGNRKHEVDLTTEAAPARCAEMLRQNEAEIALTRVIEFKRIENTLIVTGVCVGAKEEVNSVCLITKGDDLESVKSVALDVSSRTSVVLTQIIFREFFAAKPLFAASEPNIEEMLKRHDAALLIGDPALRVNGNRFRIYDVAELWREKTGCGFVFAFWVVNKNNAEKAQKIDFAAARDEGLNRIEEIIDFYLPRVSLVENDFRRYLTENISYTLDAELLEGLRLYYQLSNKHDLIPGVKPIQFL